MSADRFTAEPALSRLKDFQRRTVDYVFDRMYGKEPTHRFLVADEVGLGKTLVARGVIARALEHLQDKVRRVDIVYVCSNAAIAAQNIHRLNIGPEHGFAMASRLTFLPVHIKRLEENRFNFISFTPGTTLDLKGRGGLMEERVIIYLMLENMPWACGNGLLNLLRGGVRKRDNWTNAVRYCELEINDEMAKKFRDRVDENAQLTGRLATFCSKYHRLRKQIPGEDWGEQLGLIGELRHLLAVTCIDGLEPDLLILDEFQRFKDLLDGEDDAALLARTLFRYPEVRILLLSATPYKMLSLDQEQEDDHYADFIRTFSFLAKDDRAGLDKVKDNVQQYRRAIFSLADCRVGDLSESRSRLQAQLLKYMCRTERIGLSKGQNAMLAEMPTNAELEPSDLEGAALADRAARLVGARDAIEYWKSSPYLLNFFKDYDLRRKVDRQIDTQPDELRNILLDYPDQMLNAKLFDQYAPLDPANSRLRALFSETLDAGLWKLLWLPPSLPYTKPGGMFAGIDSVTKCLVFSAWNAVPNAIAALGSYEAERRMLETLGRDVRHAELYDKIKPLLKFSKETGRLSGMPVLALLFPSPTLASEIDPLTIAIRTGDGAPVSAENVLESAEQRCRELLDQLPPGGEGLRADERWYWAVLAMLEAHSRVREWCRNPEGWTPSGDEVEENSVFREHVALFESAIAGELDLGPRPQDLVKVMAQLAIAGPGTCALRALRRLAPEAAKDDIELLTAASRVAAGFRTLFNIPETIALLRGSGEESYWRLVIQYCVDGNIQALLDEQAHILLESLGLADCKPQERFGGVAANIESSLSIRTVRIAIDEFPEEDGVLKRRSFNTRCRFALRFGEIRDDRGQTLHRAEVVRDAFNSPFRPFVLATTSIGQEGLDFHVWCHAVMHWNLPSNPVDLEQREGRVHRYKGHAIRKNVAKRFGLGALSEWDGIGDPWGKLFACAVAERQEGMSDIVPFWLYEVENGERVERRIPLLPYSREVPQLDRLRRGLTLYRLVFGQPRQEDLLAYLARRMSPEESVLALENSRICLEPPR